MKLRFYEITIGDRSIAFREGLNIVYGPVASGKTSLLRLCRLLIGGNIDGLPPEVMACASVSASLSIGVSGVRLFRPLASSVHSYVDVAGDLGVFRLPLARTDASLQTFAQWMLFQLGLPRIEVPSAPTRPESDPTPVSMNDYLLYADLPKEDIRSSVFGHRHPFKDIKRRYVFEIIYGQYDLETAALQDELRDVRARMREMEVDAVSLARIFSGTAWENRAALESELANSRAELRHLEAQGRQRASDAIVGQPEITAMRDRVLRQELTLSELRGKYQREEADLSRFQTLVAQLETQISRLTRAIVADEALLDIDFVVCPRCGASVEPHADAADNCYLCHQKPPRVLTRADLIREQNRLAEQMEETKELVRARLAALISLRTSLSTAETARLELGRALDSATNAYVSDRAQEIERSAAQVASLRQAVKRIDDYLQVYRRREGLEASLVALRQREGALLDSLEVAKVRKDEVEARILLLENTFTEILLQLRLPGFLGTPIGHIDRRTYMPSVSGRSFETLQSEGLSVEVNVAHALAHQLVSAKLGLKLPSILLLDGISGSFGDRGYDPARVDALYGQIQRVCAEANGLLQVIAADIRVPESARDAVVLELSEGDRLARPLGSAA